MKNKLFFIVTFITLWCNSLAVSAQVVSYRRLQFLGTVEQTKKYSCGAAAIATLMSQYGLASKFKKILKRMA
jgi:predicted double-glycine peptidase